MQFTPAGASAAHQKLGAGPPGRPVEAASAGGAPEHARVAQLPIPRPSGRASRVCVGQLDVRLFAAFPVARSHRALPRGRLR